MQVADQRVETANAALLAQVEHLRPPRKGPLGIYITSDVDKYIEATRTYDFLRARDSRVEQGVHKENKFFSREVASLRNKNEELTRILNNAEELRKRLRILETRERHEREIEQQIKASEGKGKGFQR